MSLLQIKLEEILSTQFGGKLCPELNYIYDEFINEKCSQVDLYIYIFLKSSIDSRFLKKVVNYLLFVFAAHDFMLHQCQLDALFLSFTSNSLQTIYFVRNFYPSGPTMTQNEPINLHRKALANLACPADYQSQG